MVLLIGVSMVIIVYIGGLQVVWGLISMGNIVEFVIYVNMLIWLVIVIGWIVFIVQQVVVFQKWINEFLSFELEIMNYMEIIMEEICGVIVFEKVFFVYFDIGIQAFKDVSFELQVG